MNKKDLLKNATKKNGRILAINEESDNLVELPPGSVTIGFGEDGPEFRGLKKGFRIATPADVKRKEEAEAKRKAKEAKASSPESA